MDEPPLRTKPVPALVRTKRILDELAADNRPKGASELARSLGLPKSTVHGLCRTLVDLGLLLRVGATQFVIGPHVLSWANAFEGQSNLTQAFASLADDATRPESINLSILAGQDVMYVGCRQGSDPLGVSFRVGLRFPAPYAATGKAIFSTMPEEEVTRLFSDHWPSPLTQNSVTGVDALLRELEATRERGYSIDNGQLREAMICFGAPVFGPGNSQSAIAGVAAGVLSAGLSDDHKGEIASWVREFAAELSRRLGAQSRG